MAAFEQSEHIKAETVEARNEIQLLSKQMEQLEPILEIPALFDTLLRNGHHEEAMDLQLFTQRLPIRYPNIPYLNKLADLETNNQAMLVQLISMLKGHVKLPICIRVIGYLRRLGYKDTPLRILFLSLRHEYILSLLAIIKESHQHDFIRRWIETQREHLFDVITHFKAIFPDHPNNSLVDSQILSSFCNMAVQNLLQVLTNFLNEATDASMLPSIVTQVMYYGMSLGRIGLDFRPLAVRLFENCLLKIIQSQFNQAAAYFQVATTGLERPAPSLTGNDLLLKNPPVAILYNQYMNALNQLRYLPILNLHKSLKDSLDRSLQIVVDKLNRASSIVKRESEITAWILSEAIKQVCEGLDMVLLGRVVSDPSPIINQLDHLSAAAKAHRTSIQVSAIAIETEGHQQPSESLELINIDGMDSKTELDESSLLLEEQPETLQEYTSL